MYGGGGLAASAPDEAPDIVQGHGVAITSG
jgi:hypothetical protein